MKRIGLTASKIAKGNIWFYHLAVVTIACLVGLFVFIACSAAIALAIFISSLVLQKLLPSMDQAAWVGTFQISLKLLGLLIGALIVVAIGKNIQIKA